MGTVSKGKFKAEIYKDGQLVESNEFENTIVHDGFNCLLKFEKAITVRQDETLSIIPVGSPIHLVDFTRASGLMECPTCNKLYYDHPLAPVLGYDSKPFLHILCDGSYVKL